VAFADASVEALAAQHADLDLDHVEPAGVFGGVVELQPAQQPSGFRGWERLVEGAGGMGREVIEDDPDLLGLGIMDIENLAHALGEVASRPMVGDLDLAPGAVRVEEDEEVERAVARYSQS
jgi:hypothetical protein